jgi:hypothetical protein
MQFRLRKLLLPLILWGFWVYIGWCYGLVLAVMHYNYKQTPEQIEACSWISATIAFVTFLPLYVFLESLSARSRQVR